MPNLLKSFNIVVVLVMVSAYFSEAYIMASDNERAGVICCVEFARVAEVCYIFSFSFGA